MANLSENESAIAENLNFCSAQENVKSLTFYSKSLKKDRKVEVYLPVDYNENESVRYPVIYFLVDFPFDGNGNFIDSVWNRWLLNDYPFLAKKISKEDDLAIYFDCGTYDEVAAYPLNTSFGDSLDILGLPYQLQSYSEDHYDRDSRYPIGLAFLDSVMNKVNKNNKNEMK